MANEKERQTIDEIERTVEELRQKIELLTQGTYRDEKVDTNEATSINIEFSQPNESKENPAQENSGEGKDWVKIIGQRVDDLKQGVVDFVNDPKVVSAKETAKEKSLKALDQLKSTLHDLKENENVVNASEKAKEAFNNTMGKRK